MAYLLRNIVIDITVVLSKGAGMEKKKVIDKRQVKLEEIMKEGYIPFLGGRPEREYVIGKDDIMNLKIILNTTESVNEFLLKL
jgi:hypothetical protein